ncbi:class I SAM-dependent DNA methyltransferase [Mycolicibacterium sp. BiH015]|uniref:class I SAM-dependent DNA methyltransferase n=1 Tax=Mycolicibacterium sp. BiH015 TaxID=3018808 RepID=UPI0022DED888|nr:DNA methyltransferase [Mycolicibacterium sp. BiH015]MDA2889838.1 class I SAM-dependent DNA methyltransferase [Mycolicibacterium sp. BiH015]
MPKALSLNEIRSRCAAFAAEWRSHAGYERGEGQEFVRELLGAFGLPRTRAALYERRAQRSSTGRQGFIDALIPGLAVIEMKSAGEDLEKAEEQALDYLDGLSEAEYPRYVISSDFTKFRVLDLGADGEDTAVTEFTLEELPGNAEVLGFLAGYQVRGFGSKQQEKASIKAAQLMAALYQEVESAGLHDDQVSVFLTRTLFCLYADDAAIWERDLFAEFIETRTAEDGSDLGAQMSVLFQAMNTDVSRRSASLDELIARFPYVNGGIFEEPLPIPSFRKEVREAILVCCAFSWDAISPAIFGSLFQAVKDKEARDELGEHYTTETNILKLIGPLFLDELNQRFTDNYHSKAALKRLLDALGNLRIFDPACGCGNFLVVTLRELRALELRILVRLQELGENYQRELFAENIVRVKIDHFFGIEIDDWPARIAGLALHLVNHQANKAMELAIAVAPEPLPLIESGHITVDNALQVDWATVVAPTPEVYLLGNPPFMGDHSRSAEQLAELRAVWGLSSTSRMDYVTGWYKKAIDYYGQIPGRFAFVSTNSITQGDQTHRVFGPIFEAGWRIRFAHRTFAWTSEAPNAAVVHCVIVGFDRGGSGTPAPVIYTYATPRGAPAASPAKNINGYLLDGPDFLVPKRTRPLSPSLPQVHYGSKPTDGGFLIVDAAEYPAVAADPNMSPYLRPYVGAREMLYDTPRWCLWLIDLEPKHLRASAELRRRLKGVEEARLDSDAESTREWADRPRLFRQIGFQSEQQFVGIPEVSSESRLYLPIAELEPRTIISNKVYGADDPDGFLFSIAGSSMLITWMKAVGGRMKSDPSFSSTIMWNNFPLPEVTAAKRTAICAAGKAVLEARALYPDRTLAELYHPQNMPTELLRAHAQLDRAVDAVFGLRGRVDIDARLKALYTSFKTLSDSGTFDAITRRSRRRRS